MPVDRRDGQSAAVLLVLIALGTRLLIHGTEDVVFGLTLIAIATVPAGALVWLAFRWRRRARARATRRWEQIATQVVRTETVEQLGHTQGGLSESHPDAAGQLSEAEVGRLSPPDP